LEKKRSKLKIRKKYTKYELKNSYFYPVYPRMISNNGFKWLKRKFGSTLSGSFLLNNNSMVRVLLEKLTEPAQEIPHVSYSLKFYYHVHNSLPLDPILSQLNKIRILQLYFFKIHF
jgi:hypothetical protein